MRDLGQLTFLIGVYSLNALTLMMLFCMVAFPRMAPPRYIPWLIGILSFMAVGGLVLKGLA